MTTGTHEELAASLTALGEAVDRLIAQRDELLAACKAALAWMKDVSSHEPERFLNPELDAMETTGATLEAAIANAGGAA